MVFTSICIYKCRHISKPKLNFRGRCKVPAEDITKGKLSNVNLYSNDKMKLWIFMNFCGDMFSNCTTVEDARRF